MAASSWPSSIMWWSLTMGALALLPRLLFHCGSRLHHWLPTSPGCPCSLRDEVLSLYPTTGSAFPMDMVQRSRLCRSVHTTAGPLLFEHTADCDDIDPYARHWHTPRCDHALIYGFAELDSQT